MTFKDDVAKEIHEKRPKITPSSVKTYASLLTSLVRKLEADEDISFFKKDKKAILEYVSKLEKPQTQKTLLSSLYIITDDDDYKSRMVDICNQVNDNYKKQKLSPEEKENRVSFDEVKAVVNGLLDKVKKEGGKENYINYLILALMSGVYLPPRRAEYADVKIKDYNKEKDNYYEKGKIVFNQYKTFYKYGQQSITIPKEVMPTMNKWLKMNDNEYLFYNVNTGKPFSHSQMTKKLQSLFGGKKIGVDALRSIFITNHYKDMPKLEEMEKLANDMGHSVSTEMTYIRR